MKPFRIYSPFLKCLVAIVLTAPNSHAQSSGLSGVVTDETGGVLPDVEITVMNKANGLQRTLLSNDEGCTSLPSSPPAPTRYRRHSRALNRWLLKA